MASLDRFRRRCRVLRMVTTGVLFCTAAVLALPYLLLPLAQLAKQPQVMAADWRYLALALVRVSPGICYLWALWAVRSALGDLGAGRLFQPTVARALRRIGYGVIAGALLSIFVVTNLSRFIEHGQGGFAYFDLSGIVLAIVGAALVLFAQLVERARKLERELDGMI